MVIKAALPVPFKLSQDITSNDARNLRMFLENVREKLLAVETGQNNLTSTLSQQVKTIVNTGLDDGGITVPPDAVEDPPDDPGTGPTPITNLFLAGSVEQTELMTIGRLDITWDASTDSNVFYEITYYLTSDPTAFTTDNTPFTSYSIYPAQIGVQYTIEVRTRRYGSDSVSAAVTGTVTITGDTVPPSTPTNFLAAGGLDKAILDWENPTDSDFLVTNIYRSTVSGFTPGTITGTYSRTGTTITVTITNHGFITGQLVDLSFTTGTATSGKYNITKTGANTFTAVDSVSGSTSGNVSTTNRIASFMGKSLVDGKVLNDGTIFYYKLKAQDVSGNESSPTAERSATPFSITASNVTAYIAAGTIDASRIVANTITADEIAANAITANELAANAVTATKILAGELTAHIVNGNVIRTSGGNARVQLDSTGIFGTTTDSSSNYTFHIKTDGTGFLGPSPGIVQWTAGSSGVVTINGSLQMINPGNIYNGKTTFSSTTAGFWLGVDTGPTAKFHIGNSTKYMKWDGSALTVNGLIQTRDDPGSGDRQRVVLDPSSNELSFYDSSHNEMISFSTDSVDGASTLVQVGKVGSTAHTGTAAYFRTNGDKKTVRITNTSTGTALDVTHADNTVAGITYGGDGAVTTPDGPMFSGTTTYTGAFGAIYSRNNGNGGIGIEAYTPGTTSVAIYGHTDTTDAGSIGVHGSGNFGIKCTGAGGADASNTGSALWIVDDGQTASPNGNRTGNPGEFVTRLVGGTQRLYMCRGDNAGGTGTVWATVA